MRDEANFPTDCSTNLIHGIKFNHLFKIPVGGKYNMVPSDIDTTNMTSIKDICDQWQAYSFKLWTRTVWQVNHFWDWFEHIMD